jgi:hypothetical protein
MKNIDNIMSEEQFWEIIEKSINKKGDMDRQLDNLEKKLSNLKDEELMAFQTYLDEMIGKSYLSSLWACGYIAKGGCSDDGFEYFQLWVISCGKTVYYDALTNPDTLYDSLKKVEKNDEVPEFEDIGSLAIDVYELRLSDDTAFEDDLFYHKVDEFKKEFNAKKEFNTDIEFDWNDDEPETLRKHCPRVFDHFWENPLG